MASYSGFSLKTVIFHSFLYVYPRVITHQGFQSATWDPWRVPFATSDTWDDLPLKFLEAIHVDQLNVQMTG